MQITRDINHITSLLKEIERCEIKLKKDQDALVMAKHALASYLGRDYQQTNIACNSKNHTFHIFFPTTEKANLGLRTCIFCGADDGD